MGPVSNLKSKGNIISDLKGTVIDLYVMAEVTRKNGIPKKKKNLTYQKGY